MNGTLRIMIVEDNPMNLKLATDILEFEGFQVYGCPNAENAIEKLKLMRPDLILMDVALPGIDGLELTRILKADDSTKGITIIALTAFAMKTDKDRVMEAGCDGYITKPIDTRSFAKQIVDLMK